MSDLVQHPAGHPLFATPQHARKTLLRAGILFGSVRFLTVNLKQSGQSLLQYPWRSSDQRITLLPLLLRAGMLRGRKGPDIHTAWLPGSAIQSPHNKMGGPDRAHSNTTPSTLHP